MKHLGKIYCDSCGKEIKTEDYSDLAINSETEEVEQLCQVCYYNCVV